MTFYISPYRRMASLRHAMDRLLEESFNDNNPADREMLLAVDVKASDDTFVIKALVPGLESEDLSIEILNNTVTLRGEFKGEAESEHNGFLVSELPTGRFTRTLTLPTALDPNHAEATIKNGVLVLRIPKAEAARPKTIKVAIS